MAGFMETGNRVIPGSWCRTAARACYSTRVTTALARPSHRDDLVFTHADCACNECIALRARHQYFDMPPPDPRELWRLHLAMEHFYKTIEPTERETVNQLVKRYSGAQRAQFERAAESLRLSGIAPKDCGVSMFLKDDKYVLPDGQFWAEAEQIKAPRCIQYRNKRYCIEIGRYLHPIEKRVYEWRDEQKLRCIAKARNSHQRAADLREAWDRFAEPVALLLDHSKFDAHVSIPLLQFEHSVYKRFNPSRQFAWLCKQQLRNRGSTKNRTHFYTPGTRMSGDMNTGLGNSVINLGLLRCWLNEAKVPGYVYVDGDDSVVMVERRDRERLPSADWFRQFGMHTKCEETTTFEHVEFCQTRPVHDGHAWRMVRNPLRVLQRSGWTPKRYDDKFLPRLVKSIGMCELACNDGVPVLQAFSAALIRAGGGEYWSGVELHRRAMAEHYGPARCRERPITAAARVSFALAWGITPLEQEALEREVQTLRAIGTYTAGNKVQRAALGWPPARIRFSHRA